MSFMNLRVGGLYVFTKTLYKEFIDQKTFNKIDKKINDVLEDFSSCNLMDQTVWYSNNMFSNKEVTISVLLPRDRSSWCGRFKSYIPFMVLENCGEHIIDGRTFRVLQIIQTDDGETVIGYFKFCDEEFENKTMISDECEVYELFV